MTITPTPWWAREITCPSCGAEPGRACQVATCHDRIEAALCSLETRLSAMRSELRGDAKRRPLSQGFVGSLNPDRRIAGVERLEAAVASARAALAGEA